MLAQTQKTLYNKSFLSKWFHTNKSDFVIQAQIFITSRYVHISFEVHYFTIFDAFWHHWFINFLFSFWEFRLRNLAKCNFARFSIIDIERWKTFNISKIWARNISETSFAGWDIFDFANHITRYLKVKNFQKTRRIFWAESGWSRLDFQKKKQKSKSSRLLQYKMFETSYGSDSKCAVFPRSRRMFYIPRTCPQLL